MEWILSPFGSLATDQLYELLQLRSRVFVVEQQCVFLDMDGIDQACHHLLGFEAGRLLACSRIVPAGISYQEPSIGRVATHPDYRRRNIGRELMRRSLAAVAGLYGPTPVRIGAQLYLERFYQDFGFGRVGEIYDEDGIDHIYMLRPSS